MKRFKTISTGFIIVIAVIFSCNVFYLVSLYRSIRNDVEREVLTAMNDADLDDLMFRARRAQSLFYSTRMKEEQDTIKPHGQAEATVYKDEEEELVSIRTGADGKVTEERAALTEESSFSNQMVATLCRQLHMVMDGHVPFDTAVLDSILMKRLADRFIYPDILRVEVMTGNDSVVCANPRLTDKYRLDTFRISINPDQGLYYKAYITPLTRHILSKMIGVIVTLFLLMITFTSAFIYLFHTVSRLRTIEEMKDDFVSNMTHELKTPIAIAYSANDALLNYDTSNDQEKKVTYLRIANKQLKRLGELVENILAMSMERRKSMKFKPEIISLQSFTEELAAANRMRRDKVIDIKVDIDDNATVETDRVHFANVMNNLIDNAIKYSGDNVEIVIRGDADGLSVSDNGIGIPPKALPHLFKKFYRVPHGNRQDVRGYGIGLYYVKSIVDRMGWAIDVRSKVNEGSVFTIKFNNSYEA